MTDRSAHFSKPQDEEVALWKNVFAPEDYFDKPGIEEPCIHMIAIHGLVGLSLELASVDGGDSREFPFTSRYPYTWPSLSHTGEIWSGARWYLESPKQKDWYEHHGCVWSWVSSSNSGIEDKQQGLHEAFECKLDQFKHSSTSNGETNARKGTEDRLTLWEALDRRRCLTKPNSGYGVRDSRIFKTNVERLEDAEREERGECKQECRFAVKKLISKDVSFEQECEDLERLGKISGTAMARRFALYSYTHERPLVWLDLCDVLAKIKVNRDEVAQWGLRLKNYRPSLNDSQSLHHLSWIDKICLVLNQTVFPPLVWMLLLSLHLEPPSLLDQKFQQLTPHARGAIIVLQGHHTTSLTIVLCLSGLRVLALLKTPATMNERDRSFTYPCCTLSLMAGLSIWIKIGGSVLGFFLVLMPYALSVGVSVGVFLSLRGLSGRENSTEPLMPIFRRRDEGKS